MSRMSLKKRLLPIRKAWKKLTSRLQTKLHKLHRKRRLIKPSLTLHPRYYKRYALQKRAAPIYIDDLFKSEFREATATVITGKKTDADDEKRNMVAGTSQGSAEDALWESLGLASPQVLGIDERADDFIARFRAEMRRQARMERNL